MKYQTINYVKRSNRPSIIANKVSRRDMKQALKCLSTASQISASLEAAADREISHMLQEAAL